MHFQVSTHFLPTSYVPFNNSELWSVQVLIPTDIECLSFSWNIGPAHIISISTEIYFFLNYGLEQVVQQYDWLEKDLKVRNLWLQYSPSVASLLMPRVLDLCSWSKEDYQVYHDAAGKNIALSVSNSSREKCRNVLKLFGILELSQTVKLHFLRCANISSMRTNQS